MRRISSVAVALAVIGLLVWAFLPQAPIVDIAPVKRADLTVHIEAEGKARIREVVTVSAPITGVLERIRQHPGDAVQAGQTVARIGPAAPALLDARARAVAEAAVAAAAAAVDLARSQLDQATAAEEYARTESSRARALFERAAVSERLLDDAILAERTAAAATASARANLAVRERERESAQAVLDGGLSATRPACCIDIKAPVDGRILRVVTEDEQVLQAGTPILQLGDLTDIGIVADVLSRDAVRIRVGAEAMVTGWGGPDLVARVDRVEPGAATQVSALGIEEQRVEVRLSLQDPPPAGLGHDFRVTARIAVWEGKDILTVPVAALFREGADWAVYEVSDGRAMLRTISIGHRTELSAELVDGLGEGAVVILHPDDRFADGDRVAVAR